MMDCSHANSSKHHERQRDVASDIAGQIAGGGRSIFGVMVESHLAAGAQKFSPGKDDLPGWDDSLALLALLAQAVQTLPDSTAEVIAR